MWDGWMHRVIHIDELTTKKEKNDPFPSLCDASVVRDMDRKQKCHNTAAQQQGERRDKEGLGVQKHAAHGMQVSQLTEDTMPCRPQVRANDRMRVNLVAWRWHDIQRNVRRRQLHDHGDIHTLSAPSEKHTFATQDMVRVDSRACKWVLLHKRCRFL